MLHVPKMSEKFVEYKKKAVLSVILMFIAIAIVVITYVFIRPYPSGGTSSYFVPLILTALAFSLFLELAKLKTISPLDISELFKQVEPEKLVKTDRFVLARKNKIYMLKTIWQHGFFLLRFKIMFETNEKKIKLPDVSLLSKFRKKINGIPIARFEGNFTIPIEEDKYAEGEGVLYYVEVEKYIPIDNIPITQKIDKNVFLKLIEELSREAV